VYGTDQPTNGAPPPLILREDHNFVSIRHQLRAEQGADTGRLGHLLELDRSPDPVGVGAGQGGEAAAEGGLDQRLGTGGTLAEGEVGVAVEVGKHFVEDVEDVEDVKDVKK
jgi:hypothetical protein